jgi:hypothetical protein
MTGIRQPLGAKTFGAAFLRNISAIEKILSKFLNSEKIVEIGRDMGTYRAYVCKLLKRAVQDLVLIEIDEIFLRFALTVSLAPLCILMRYIVIGKRSLREKKWILLQSSV